MMASSWRENFGMGRVATNQIRITGLMTWAVVTFFTGAASTLSSPQSDGQFYIESWLVMGKNLSVCPLVRCMTFLNDRHDDFFYFGSERIEMQCRSGDILKYFSFAIVCLTFHCPSFPSRFQAECSDGYPSKAFVLNQRNISVLLDMAATLFLSN